MGHLLVLALSRQPLSLLDDLLDRSHHIEGDLGQMVQLTVEDLLETLDCLLERHQLALGAREHLGDLEGLRQETLNLTSARHSGLVVLRQLVHTQDSDDILERFEVLHK